MDQYDWQGHHNGGHETTPDQGFDSPSHSTGDENHQVDDLTDTAVVVADDEPDTEDTPYSEPIPIPANVRNEVVFSERDVYRVLNSVIVLESCTEEMTRWIDLALSIGGSNIRRAITLVKMDEATFEDRAVIVETLAAVGGLAGGKVDDPIQAVLETVSRVSDLDEAQKTAMVTLARRLVRDTGGKSRIRGVKTASDVDIVKDIQSAMTGDESISESVTELGRVMSALVEASK